MSVGIDHFLIYDNESTDETVAKLRKYINGGRVTLIHWPMRGGQIDAYNHAAKLMADNAEWIGFLDIDEFLVPHEHNHAYAFLESLNADQVILPWRNFSYGGHNARPGGSAPETYFWAHQVPQDGITQVKHFVRANLIERATAHASFIRSENTKLPTGEPQRPTHAIKNPTYRVAQINHYATRSFSENQERVKKGQVSGSSHKRIEQFAPLTEGLASRLDYDDSILKHFAAFKSESMRWKDISQYPHRFGLRQPSPYLASMNNVLFYLTKSFGNYLKDEQVIKPNTDYQFLQGRAGAEPVNVGRLVDESRRTSFHFDIRAEGYLKYFQGTIHYGDFVRRFGFECLHSTRRQEVDGEWSATIDAGSNGMLALVDFESQSQARIIVRSNKGDRVLCSESPNGGRSCVILYLPLISDHDKICDISIQGKGSANEVIFGRLPA